MNLETIKTIKYSPPSPYPRHPPPDFDFPPELGLNVDVELQEKLWIARNNLWLDEKKQTEAYHFSAQVLLNERLAKTHPMAFYNVGVCYDLGLGGIQQDSDKASELFSKGAALYNADCQNAHGVYFYTKFRGKNHDALFSAMWCFQLAAKQGHLLALSNLAGCHVIKKNFPEALRLYRLTDGLSNSQFKLGIFYEFGYCNLKCDSILAKKYYSLAASQGHQKAKECLVALERKIVDKKAKEQVVALDKKEVTENREEKQSMTMDLLNLKLGMIHQDLWINDKKKQREAYSFSQQMLATHPMAYYNVGFCYLFGVSGVQKDTSKAREYFAKGASLNNAECQTFLGHFYNFGLNGFESNIDQAMYWYNLASQQGHFLALSSLAGCYTTKKNYAEALRLYHLTEELSTSQFQLGIHYEYGYGVECDLIQAKCFFIRAATHGDQRAMEKVLALKDVNVLQFCIE